MGEFMLALLIAGVAGVTEGRNVLMGGARKQKVSYVFVTVLGLALTLTAALGLADGLLDAAAGWIGEVLHT